MAFMNGVGNTYKVMFEFTQTSTGGALVRGNCVIAAPGVLAAEAIVTSPFTIDPDGVITVDPDNKIYGILNGVKPVDGDSFFNIYSIARIEGTEDIVGIYGAEST